MAKCIICGSEQHESILRTKDNDSRGLDNNEVFNLVRCKNCSMVFVENMPSKRYIAKYYKESYYAQNNMSNKIINKIIMASRLSKMPKRHGGSILDYGCGNGDFLLGMKQHDWDVNGVEFSEDGRKISSKKLGINVMNENEFYMGKKQFDVITMWHVLEHLYEPNKTLKQMNKLLKKDGILVISIPNIKSIQFSLFGKNTFHLDIPRHAAHYSPKTMALLLEKNGFAAKGFNHYSIEYNPFGFMQGFLNSIGCEFNFLYNVIKRGYTRRVSMMGFLYSFLATFILLPFLILIAIPWTYFESMLGYGASFVIYTKRKTD